MANLNKVFLMGNLTRDPELRYTPSGLAVTNFTVAANRHYSTPSGEKKETTTFMRIIVWGKRAETCAEFLNKGSLVLVEGHIQSRSWQAQDGTKRNSVEVVAENVQFLGAPRGVSQTAKHPQDKEAQQPLDVAPDVDAAPDEIENEKATSTEGEAPF
jgi:single-strand DNA-binding protein